MSCSALGCVNRYSAESNLQFFRFPFGEQDTRRLMQWVANMRREDWKPTKFSRLCSLHFEEHHFTTNSRGNRRLKGTAVPTLFIIPPYVVKKQTRRKQTILTETHFKEEERPAVKMEKSSSASEQPRRSPVEDELDGFPVLRAVEEDWDSSSSSKTQHSDDPDENENEKAQQSRTKEGTSRNEPSASSQDSGGNSREETMCSPLTKIKDEPIDEGYDKALIPQSDISRVKEELENGDQESVPPPDELRISSVFSVRGAAEAMSAPVAASQPSPFPTISQVTSAIKAPLMVLPTQPQTHLQAKPLTQIQLQLPPQIQNQLHIQPQPPPPPQLQPPAASIRICCSGCSKVLQKGQTAFQRKGSNQLFCSTVCLTGFTLPPAISIAPKKTCHLCLKVIGNPKDLITVPVDSMNTLKEFCSQACLTIYKSRVEGLNEDNIIRCSMCRKPSEIQHEVNHQGVLHKLCSDECFSRFRSSKRLSMSCCEICGNCNVTGNYHLVQVEDAVKKFCSPVCISTFKQKSGKRVHCPGCQEFKGVDQMLEGTNAQGVIEFFCSSRCVTNSQASRTLSGASFPCTNCQKLAIPQYHLAMPDGSIRNFCTYDCVGKFQERLQKPSPQVNGSSTVTANASGVAPRGPQHPSAAPRPSAPPQITNPTSNQTTIPPHVPAPGLAAPQGSQQHQQQPGAAAASSPGPARLTCKQCQKPISSKPEVLQYKNHVGLFCSRLCCDSYKREKDVKATCEYCKEEKILKDITMYEHKLRPFCCEGCKLLFKHELSKQHGAQCRVCAYCSNMTHNTIQNHFGGKLEEFCTEECMSLYTVLFYEMAKCYSCKTQGTLSESLKWDGTIKHFCNLHCVLQFCCKSIIPDQPISNGVAEEYNTLQFRFKMADNTPRSSDGNSRYKRQPERHSPPKALKILGLIGGENSEVEDLSDMDDVVGDPQYQPPKQEPISSSEEEEDSSGCEDPFPQSSQLIGGLKRHRDEYEDDRVSDCDVHNHRSQLCRRLSLTQQDEADVSNDVPEETTPPGPSRREQFEKERGLRWRTSSTLKPIQEVQFKHEEEMVQNRESWTPLDYIEQYIDKDLMKMIADCSNATSLARCEIPLNTSTDEIYHYFGACILMSCVPYPSIRMYWFKTLKFPAITEKFTRDRFFRLRRSLKVLVDDDVPDDLRERDKFWKVRPFLNRVLKGCRSQTRPKCVSIDEQMIPFTGACPSRQFLPMKPNPVGIKNFVCATEDGIVLDFDVYQGANALLEQVQQQPGDLHLDLGGLVADRLSQTLHPNTKIYCGRFFTSIQVLELMLKKQMYVTGTVKKNRVAAAVQKLPTNERLRKDGMGFSAQVTTKDGKICVVKWYDRKPVLMISSVHGREPEDICQSWNKKLKQYVTISRPNIVSEYKSKTRGVELADRMMSCYHMSGSTKKWTLRMLMYFTDLALANSWLLYRKDLTERGTPKKSIMQFLEFRMEVATTFLAQHANDSSGFSEQDEPDVFVEGKRRRPAKALPHVSFRRRSNAHLPEVVNMKNAVRCRVKGCSGKTRVRCVTCEVFLCLQGERNCYAAFHT